ncbi:hypothetical protein [Hydrogenophaga sp.]|uniref:hypothetical protein n=1 Tax=Hydrogenophaga sp. TaxID=1904254 RepID=UPI0025BB58C2|nr:hypothetical protein [Hydrogenophaga sp.]MBT9466788.1 hypothetical protein [Hydrogenophaga sp.]
MSSLEPKLEVVYYSAAIPNQGALTLLGLLFDKVHFPGVYLPPDGTEIAATHAEAERIIEAVGKRMDFETAVLISALRLIEHVPHLKEFCVFDEQSSGLGTDSEQDKLAAQIVAEIDRQIWGVRENFIPTHHVRFYKALPGGETSIEYPGMLHYPARAMIYAGEKGLPLVNDNPSLPVPGFEGAGAQNNAQLLSTILAMECAAVMLPAVRALSPLQIVEARTELRPYLLAFRASILQLSKQLNAQISQASSAEEIISAAKFLVQTDIVPVLAALENEIAKPKRNWLNVAWKAAERAPELATAFSTLPPQIALAQLIAAVGSTLVELRAGDATSSQVRSPLYYLLRMRQLGAVTAKA